jgi:hypothetical protein
MYGVGASSLRQAWLSVAATLCSARAFARDVVAFREGEACPRASPEGLAERRRAASDCSKWAAFRRSARGSRTLEAGSRVTPAGGSGVPVSSRRLPQAPQPSSRDTDGLQLASSWTRDKWEFNATARGVDKWLIAHLLAAARSGRCKVSRLRKGPEVRFSCRATKVPRLAVSLAVREVRGDRRLRGADRPIKCGVSLRSCPSP